MRWLVGGALVALVLGYPVALVQYAQAQDKTTPPRDPKACADPATQAPVPPHATTGESLSDKLARSNGVLCPPSVDPEIRAPTPETGKMPVIPPPGSPGGNPNIQPK
jgi:hypothetical protein